MKKHTEIIGLLVAGIALIVAVLNWIAPFNPIGPSPLSGASNVVASSVPAPTFSPSEPVPTRLVRPTVTPEWQHVSWAPVYGLEPGICIYPCAIDGSQLIPWLELKDEIQQKLLPQVLDIPLGSTVALANSPDKIFTQVLILNQSGSEIGHIWFGIHPTWGKAEGGMRDDGLIRVGTRTDPVKIWAVFQRYTDGSYRPPTSAFLP
jgi:hypothetical protein